MREVGKIVPVILSGGAGSRLWPASRQAEPKQFLRLVTENTMLQDTILRFDEDMFHPPVFICNASHVAAIRMQMAELDQKIGAIIVEPEGRNTAACAVIAALHAQSLEDDTLFLLAPADHYITDPKAFRRVVAAAAPIADKGHLVTFGMTPDHPATGFGYIRKGEAIGPGAFHVDKFVEKPPENIARDYVASGQYFWNSGIFLFDSETLLSEMQAHAPQVAEPARQAYEHAKFDDDVIWLDPDQFRMIESRPVDKAVMERTDLAAVLPCHMGWHDIGSFKALQEIKAGEDGLATSGNVITHKVHDSLIETDGPLVAVVGLDNVGVIVRDGRVLVVNLEHAQDVKSVVDSLKALGRTEDL